MDGLQEFEKALAAEKAAEVAAQASKERKHHHHHHKSRHHRSRHDEDNEDRHRHKRRRSAEPDEEDLERRHRRSRRSEDGDERDRERRHRKKTSEKISDPKADLPIPNDERAPSPAEQSSKHKRDSWMTAPSSLDIDYIQKPVQPKPEEKVGAKKADYNLKIHKNELNTHLQDLTTGKSLEEPGDDKEEVNYTFGDEGAQWRMTKLNAVYKQAEDSGKSVEEVALSVSHKLSSFHSSSSRKSTGLSSYTNLSISVLVTFVISTMLEKKKRSSNGENSMARATLGRINQVGNYTKREN